MSDFTAFIIQDQYRAIVAEREREITLSEHRRSWKNLLSSARPSCCAVADASGECQTETRDAAIGGRLSPSV
jgi:hypothetical protein